MSGITDKFKDVAAEHKDKVEKGVDTAASAADKVTGGKYSEKISSTADKAKDAVPDERS